MQELPRHLDWYVHDTSEELAKVVCAWIDQQAWNAIADRNCFKLVLSGGSTPRAVYQKLAAIETDWTKWYLYYGDERCLPEDHADRNSVMVREAWLDQIGFPDSNHFPIPAELGAEVAAEQYAAKIKDAGALDVVLLGVGEDGHTASLFPGLIDDADGTTLAVSSAPKPPPERVSIGFGPIKQARHRLVMVTGEGKRDAITRWSAGEPLPIRLAVEAGAVVFSDRAALPGDVTPQWT